MSRLATHRSGTGSLWQKSPSPISRIMSVNILARPSGSRSISRKTISSPPVPGDRQWIHVDVERASRESPFGGTIAHGYLSLSLGAPLAMEMGLAPKDASAVFNYGLDKVRFVTPVRCGARVALQLA